jgi:endonuclease YncB( thermonuclease family)
MMRRFLFIFLLLLTIEFAPAPSFSADKNQGKVYVVDGDTFHMNGQKVGMEVTDTEILLLETKVFGRLSKGMGIKGILCPYFINFCGFRS